MTAGRETQKAETEVTLDVESFKLPDDFEWARLETWPSEFRQCFEFAAVIALEALGAMGYKMLDCTIENTPEPVTMLFAVGDRAEELRRAYLSVRAIHNPPASPCSSPEANQ